MWSQGRCFPGEMQSPKHWAGAFGAQRQALTLLSGAADNSTQPEVWACADNPRLSWSHSKGLSLLQDSVSGQSSSLPSDYTGLHHREA